MIDLSDKKAKPHNFSALRFMGHYLNEEEMEVKMFSTYDAKPFTTYHYYLDVHNEFCSGCQDINSLHLLRYRTYFLMRYPILPTSNTYYLVCSNCGDIERIDDEAVIIKLLQKSKGKKIAKYNKYSQLDFDDYIKEAPMTFGTLEELKRNTSLHIRDIKSHFK